MSVKFTGKQVELLGLILIIDLVFPHTKRILPMKRYLSVFWKLLLVIFVIRCALLVVENTLQSGHHTSKRLWISDSTGEMRTISSTPNSTE